MSELDNLTIEDLSTEQSEIAESIGLDAYKKLVKMYGGSYIYVCKEDTIFKGNRNSLIKSEFDGGNYRELALKYNLSERTVRSIVTDEIDRIRNEPLENQIKFGENY